MKASGGFGTRWMTDLINIFLMMMPPITTLIRSGRLRWYGHVMRKKCWGLGEEMYGV